MEELNEDAVLPVDANRLLRRAYNKISLLEERNDQLEEGLAVRTRQFLEAQQQLVKYKAKFGELKEDSDAPQQRTGD